MIDGGIVMMLTGALIMLAHPLGRVVIYRRAGVTEIGIVLRAAVPIAAASTSIEILVADAEAALEADALVRGIAGVGATYDQA